MAFSIGVITFFVIIMIIGVFVSRKVSTLEDYYVSDRNATTIMVAGSIVASFLSTVTFLGEVGAGYDGYPIVMAIFAMINASGYVAGALLFGRYIRRSRALTLPEYFGERFKSNRVRRAAGITTVLGMAAYLVAVTQGAGLLLSTILDINFVWALVIVWVVYTSFTFMSGAKGVLLTDTILFFFFFLTTIISVPYIFKNTGGWPDSIINTAALSEKIDIFSFHGIIGDNAYLGTPTEAVLWAIIIGLSWAIVVAVSPWQSSRYLMAKNEHIIVRASAIAVISFLTIYLLLQLSSAVVNLVNPDIVPSEMVYVWAVKNLVPTWIGVLAVSGIMAAAISSCSTFLQLIGNSLARDVFKIDDDKSLSENSLKVSRIAMLISGVVVLVITIFPPPAVMWIGFFAATIFAASWGPVAFASVHSKKVTSKGAFWSIIMGVTGLVSAQLVDTFIVDLPIYFEPVIIGFVLATLALIIGSMGNEVTSEEKAYRDNLLQIPKSFFNPQSMTVSVRFSKALIASGLVIIIFTFIFYYVPITFLM